MTAQCNHALVAGTRRCIKCGRHVPADTVTAQDRQKALETETVVALRRAVACLAVEVPGEVWDDVNAKVEAALAVLAQPCQECEALRESLARETRIVNDLRYDADRLKKKLAEAERENMALRGVVANAAIPCVYCGKENMAECPRGFPGCARADDMLCGEEAFGEEMKRLREKLAAVNRLRQSETDRADAAEAKLAEAERERELARQRAFLILTISRQTYGPIGPRLRRIESEAEHFLSVVTKGKGTCPRDPACNE